MITAKVVNLDVGYQIERSEVTELGWKVGDEFKVEEIDMGGSSTSIKLEDGGYFNSVFFEFYEDGKPLNIYEDKRFNPYL